MEQQEFLDKLPSSSTILLIRMDVHQGAWALTLISWFIAYIFVYTQILDIDVCTHVSNGLDDIR